MSTYNRSEVFDLTYKEMTRAWSANNHPKAYKKCVELLHILETSPRLLKKSQLDQRKIQSYILKRMRESLEYMPYKAEEGARLYCKMQCKPTEHIKGCTSSVDYRLERLDLARKELLQTYTIDDAKLQAAITKLNNRKLLSVNNAISNNHQTQTNPT